VVSVGSEGVARESHDVEYEPQSLSIAIRVQDLDEAHDHVPNGDEAGVCWKSVECIRCANDNGTGPSANHGGREA